MKKFRVLLLLVVMLVSSLVITACGMSDESQSTSTPSESVSESVSVSEPDSQPSSELESQPSSESTETKVAVSVDVGKGLVFDGEAEAIIGEDYFFAINLVDGYEKSEGFSVTVDGVDAEVDEVSGKYVVRNVEYGFTVLASGAEEIRYNVTFICEEFPDALAVTETSYKHTAENFKFSVMLTDFYTDCIDQIEVYYSVDGGEEILLERVDGQYTIANPKADVLIIVKNVTENKYDVGFAYNGEVKYTVENIVSGNGVPEEEIVNAISAVVGETGLTFVGWEEKITAVKSDVTYNAVLIGGEIETVTENLFTSATEDEMTAPNGYESVYREVAVWDETNKSPSSDTTVWASVSDLSVINYKELYFQIRIDKSWALLDGWSSYITCNEGGTISEWMLVSIKKTGIYDWEVTTQMIGSEGEKRTTLSKSGSTLAEIFAMELDSRTGEGNAPTEIYATEVIGVVDPSYVDPKPDQNAVVAAKSAFESGVDINGKQFVLDNEETAPNGYESVFKYEREGESAKDIHGQFYSGENLDRYDVVYFALKTAKFNLNGDYKEGLTDWLYFALVKTEEDVWSISVAHGDKIIYSQSGFVGAHNSEQNPAYSDNALDAILYGKPSIGFYPYSSADEILTVYCTEVRGIVNPDFIFSEIVPEGTEKIADSAYENGIDVGGAQFTVTTEITAPTGFESVYKYENANADNIHGQFFSGVNLDKYTSVYFALKTESINLNGSSKSDCFEWLYFVLTQTAQNTWSVAVIHNGDTVYSAEGLNGAYNSAANPAYSNNAIDAILYGNVSGFYPQKTDSGLIVYCTEVLGVVDPSYVDPNPNPNPDPEPEPEPNPNAPEIPENAQKIADSAYVSGIDVGGGCVFAVTDEMTAPSGFDSVYKYENASGGNIHGKSFSDVNLDNYTTVYFALKTAKMNFNGEYKEGNTDWLYFVLTQTAQDTWTLVVTHNGEEVYKVEGLNGAYATNENYTDNALDAILYGNPSGVYPYSSSGETLTVYCTEVKAI